MGVNAPGRPTIATFRPATCSAMFTIAGGNPECNSTAGSLVPGVMAAKAAEYPPKWAAEAVDANVAANRLKIFMVLVFVSHKNNEQTFDVNHPIADDRWCRDMQLHDLDFLGFFFGFATSKDDDDETRDDEWRTSLHVALLLQERFLVKTSFSTQVVV